MEKESCAATRDYALTRISIGSGKLSKAYTIRKSFAATMLAALLLSGCQTTSIKKDPQKGAKVRTQLAAEYIKTGDLDAAKRALDHALKVEDRKSVV